MAVSSVSVAPGVARAVLTTETPGALLTTELKTTLESTISAVKNTASYVLDITDTAAEYAQYIKAYVLDPIAFITSGNLLKSITSSMLGFVAGKNGTGKPLYVQNLRGYMQNVGDVEAYSFINQFQRNSNSPFAGAITSSLRADYLQQTTAAGFFAANKSTLASVSSNPLAYVAGDWSKGGLLAWFGLTTQDQNNPYILNYRAQNQLTRQVAEARGAKLAQANWGQGILSYCGSGPGLGATCQSYDEDGNCTSEPLNTSDDAIDGSASTVSCPVGTVQAGPGGCANTDTHQFELPIGYSCPSDAPTFDGNSGGCQYDDGLITVPLDSDGNPAYGDGITSSVDCSVSCPSGSTCVPAGPAGCADTTLHNYIQPNGFSCPGGGTFDKLSGGCDYSDGLTTYPQPPAGAATTIAAAATTYTGRPTNLGPDGGNLACAW
ncbi:MAG TPA: hypothetical protein VJK73_00810, partial [Candidatus Paceibacterota bacterium]